MFSPTAVMMIRPKHFGHNEETRDSNAFQTNFQADDLQSIALGEFERMVSVLKDNKIPVVVFDDTDDPKKPDAIFPNNWISTHRDGTVILYPLMTPNRQAEVRPSILENLAGLYDFHRIIDISHHRAAGHALEGTGSIVFNHSTKQAFANESSRTNIRLLNWVAGQIGYETISFKAEDASGRDIYHTNVMLSIGDRIAVICSEAITDPIERQMVLKNLNKPCVVDISFGQMQSFAGNVYEVVNSDKEYVLIMSRNAEKSFTSDQLEEMKGHCKLVSVDIPVIEAVGGGSARCMLAGIYLPLIDKT